MKIYTVNMLIPAIPYPIDWRVEVTCLSKAIGKAKAEIKRAYPGLKLCRGRIEQQINTEGGNEK